MKLSFVFLVSIYLTGTFAPEYLFITTNEKLFIGVVDRIEEDYAVILLEEEGDELELPIEEMGLFAERGKWLLIHKEDQKLIILRSLVFYEQVRKKQINDLLEELHDKNGSID